MRACRLMVPFLLALSMVSGSVLAAKIVECVDASGRTYFADKCPQATALVRERRVGSKRSGGPDLQKLAEESPVVLYSTNVCEACELMRHYLDKRGTPFSEKNVAEDAELQEELKKKSGALQVPVVSVGEKIVHGFNRGALKEALDGAGYPDDTAAAESGTKDAEGKAEAGAGQAESKREGS